MYEAGIISLIAVLIILLKFPRGLLRKILWLDVPIDIAGTAMFVALFAGKRHDDCRDRRADLQPVDVGPQVHSRLRRTPIQPASTLPHMGATLGLTRTVDPDPHPLY